MITHCQLSVMVGDGERLPPPCQEKTVFEAKKQGIGARSTRGRILTVFTEALSGVGCSLLPCANNSMEGRGIQRKEMVWQAERMKA